jgi:pyruvate formate lyase activating enzyme
VKETLLYQKLPGGKTRCGICQRRCLISESEWGYCQTRINQKGKLYTSIYGIVSSANLDPIEKKPVFHFKPGSNCLSLGTYGCNFRCLFCQNWQIAHANMASLNLDGQKLLSPKEAIKMALKSNAQGIAITYNEPAIWLEYSLDVFKLAQRASLYTVWVTNGYGTKEALDLIAPFLDVYRVDLKSFDNKFYQKLIKVPQAKPIFETTKYLSQKYPQIHLECVTNIIPRWNNHPKNLTSIAKWIKENLGPQTPWHVTRFYPDAELTNVPPTPPETLFKAREIGLKQGLKFVYIGNMPVEKEDDTICPKCGNLAIRRTGYLTEILGVEKDGTCSDCGEDLNIKI